MSDLTPLVSWLAGQGARRLIWLQLAIGVTAIAFCGTAAFLIYPSLHKAKQSEIAQQANANRAETKLNLVALSTLQRIQLLDIQSRDLTDGELPELYLWKGGLQKGPLSPEQSQKLSAILSERRFLIGDAGPLLSYSPPLHTYVCQHFWFVIAESVPSTTAEEYLRVQKKKDPRFTTAETIASLTNPAFTGIAIGFFIPHDEALALAREIGVPPSSARPWGFETNEPTCSIQ